MKNSIFLKIYLLVMSIVGAIGMFIGYGIVAYNILEYKIISDTEYLIGNNSREITNCENNTYQESNKQPNKPSESEIKKCKDSAAERILLARSLNYKENLIRSIVRGTLFMILFATHFPRFKRID